MQTRIKVHAKANGYETITQLLQQLKTSVPPDQKAKVAIILKECAKEHAVNVSQEKIIRAHIAKLTKVVKTLSDNNPLLKKQAMTK